MRATSRTKFESRTNYGTARELGSQNRPASSRPLVRGMGQAPDRPRAPAEQADRPGRAVRSSTTLSHMTAIVELPQWANDLGSLSDHLGSRWVQTEPGIYELRSAGSGDAEFEIAPPSTASAV